MFETRMRALIERHCTELRERVEEIGKVLASCNPYEREITKADLSGLDALCRDLSGRGAAIGLPDIDLAADALEAALAGLSERSAIEPWDMIDLMRLQAKLACAVDELEAEKSELFASCTAPDAREVASLSGGGSIASKPAGH